MELLKLVAMDQDDLEVVSTHLQDAEVTVGDVHWRPAEKRLVMSLARFDWEGSVSSPPYRRRRTALRFDRINSIKCRNVSCSDKHRVLNLLAIGFEGKDPPGGIVTFTFSGDVMLRIEVECLECELVDLGPVWTTTCCPQHPVQPEEVTVAANAQTPEA
jgi:hypothetical protein